MQKYFFSAAILIIVTLLQATPKNNNPPKWINILANDVGLEVVKACELPYINPFGIYGSQFIEGIIHTNHKVYNKESNWYFKSLRFVIFLCRKRKQKEESNDQSSSINDYDYFLLFAASENTNPKIADSSRNYKIQNILELEVPVGMHFLHGNLKMEMSEFVSIKTLEEKGPTGIDISFSWTTPIVIPYEKSRQVLIFYEDEWMMSTLREW